MLWKAATLRPTPLNVKKRILTPLIEDEYYDKGDCYEDDDDYSDAFYGVEEIEESNCSDAEFSGQAESDVACTPMMKTPLYAQDVKSKVTSSHFHQAISCPCSSG